MCTHAHGTVPGNGSTAGQQYGSAPLPAPNGSTEPLMLVRSPCQSNRTLLSSKRDLADLSRLRGLAASLLLMMKMILAAGLVQMQHLRNVQAGWPFVCDFLL